jgi:transcriptional regulator with XRE-family HTH domain
MPVANKPHRDALLESYSIGLKLRTLRNGKGLTLSRLGGESGLSSALLCKLESDLMVPTLATLAKICRVYGIGLGYFFAEVQHQSSAITRKAQMLEGRREQGTVKSTPLHVPHAESKQVSQLIEPSPTTTVTLSELGRRTELTAYVLDGSLRISSAGAEEHLLQGDCIVLDTDATVLVSGGDTRCRLLALVAR